MPSSAPAAAPIYLHPDQAAARRWTHTPTRAGTEGTVLRFHQTLPDYATTPLHSLPSLAAELGVGRVLVKDESSRFGLPAFKILGASWAVYRAVGWHLGIPVADGQVGIAELGAKARKAGVEIVTATEGNCGRAVARMARLMGVPCKVYVPAFMSEGTRELIRGEEAEVVVNEGSYDDLIPIVYEEGEDEDTILVLDVGFEGYTDFPKYFVQGYGTMLAEADKQVLEATSQTPATHAIVPCGAGSVAESVIAHYKGAARDASQRAAVIAVEATSAPSLMESLKAGKIVSVETDETIMAGMNCGTLSTTAWPVLQAGVDACVLVGDPAAHAAVRELEAAGVQAGPCGGASLAALRSICANDGAREELGLGPESVVVCYCTEGTRDYLVPSS